MRKQIKDKLSSAFSVLLLFILLFFSTTFVSLNIVLKISMFTEVPWYVYVIVVGTSLFVNLIISIVYNHNFDREYSIIWFLREHLSGFITSFLILNLFIISIHKETMLTWDRAISLLGVEWAIFAITIGAFAVWHALIFDKVYIFNERESVVNDESTVKKEIDEVVYLTEKSSLRYAYISNFDPVIYLVINLFAVILATASCFLMGEYSIFSETIVIFAAYCSTNALIVVMLGIVSDLSKKRKELLGKTKVKPSQINEKYDNIKILSFLHTLDELDKKISLKDLKTDDEKMNCCVARCYQLLLEYREDEKSAFKNKNELLNLFRQLAVYGQRVVKKNNKKAKRLIREMKKISKIIES